MVQSAFFTHFRRAPNAERPVQPTSCGDMSRLAHNLRGHTALTSHDTVIADSAHNFQHPIAVNTVDSVECMLPSPLLSLLHRLSYISLLICLVVSIATIPSFRALASVLPRTSLNTTLASRPLLRSHLLASHLLPAPLASSKLGSLNSRVSTSSLPPQPIQAMSDSDKSQLEKATFAAGCFWSVELIFQREPGVVDTKVGYTGGKVNNPSYEAVCSGRTGHAEAVQVVFNPKEVTYRRLLDIFFDKHDSTQLDRQGNDVGSQYRSGIWYYSEQQRKEAEERKAEEQKQQRKPVVTEVTAAQEFYVAEDYHQRYLEKGGQCAAKGDKTHIRCYG